MKDVGGYKIPKSLEKLIKLSDKPVADLIALSPFDSQKNLRVILETPRGSRNKYSFDKETGLIECKFTMPLGMTFPFDFGFIPSTLAEDGDPLDILVLMDEPCVPGCFVRTNLLGALRAKQTEKDKSAINNDRLIAVQINSLTFGDVHDMQDLSTSLKEQIEHFFVSYNQPRGKLFECLGWIDADQAYALIEQSFDKYRTSGLI